MVELTKDQAAHASTPGGLLVIAYLLVLGVLVCLAQNVTPGEIEQWIEDRPDPVLGLLAALAVFLVVILDKITARIGLGILTLYKGQWIRWRWIRSPLINHRVAKANEVRDAYAEATKTDRPMGYAEHRIWQSMKWRITNESAQAPLRIGEIISAGQQSIPLRFGFNLGTAFRFLGSIVPEEVIKQQKQTALGVTLVVQACAVSLLSIALVPFWCPLVLICPVTLLLARLLLPSRVRAYYENAHAIVIEYRLDLYKQLGFQAPTGAVEVETGTALEKFVRYGRVSDPLERLPAGSRSN